MQTQITDKDFYKSASNLNRQHLQANIYEPIQVLASLLGVNDKLVNPKRDVSNHPTAKLWAGYEQDLVFYIGAHISEWTDRYGFKEESINIRNFRMLCDENGIWPLSFQMYPKWITDELIETHRSVLIQKEIKKEDKMRQALAGVGISSFFTTKEQEEAFNKIEKIYDKDNIYHYRKLWPDCPTDLKMRYDWKSNEVMQM
jgi:hypothetical protein